MTKPVNIIRRSAAVVVLFVLASLLDIGLARSQSSQETIRLQLRWTHHFQFAGYYAAEAQGYYREKGLHVVLLEGKSADLASELVERGVAEYGTGSTDVLLRRTQGAPLVMLAAIFQHSAHVVAVRENSGILTPADFRGKRVMASFDRSPDLKAMFLKASVDPSTFAAEDRDWKLEKFAEGRVDAMSCYTTTVEYDLRHRGIGYRIINPSDYGIDFYGDCLFTSEMEINNHPERVEAFRDASLRGWKYAMDHPDELIRLIFAKYGPQDSTLTYESLAFEANVMARLILPDLVEVGTMSPERWERIRDAYSEVGMIEGHPSLEGFLYEPVGVRQSRWWRPVALIGCMLALIGLGVFVWSLELRREVRRRTAQLREQNIALAQEVDVRTRTELALRRSELKLRTLIDAMPDLILVQDSFGRWTEANALARRFLGWKGDQEYSLSTAATPIPPYARVLLEDDATEPHRKEHEIEGPDGNRVVYDVIKVPFNSTDDKAGGAILIGRDITERKRAEESLAQANQALNAIVVASPIPIVAFSASHIIIEWNPAAEKLFGWSAEEVLGGAIPIRGSDEVGSRELWDAVFKAGAESGTVLRRKRKDGAELALFASAAVLQDAIGRPVGSVVMFVDITENERAQEQLRSSLREKEVLLKEIHHRVKNNLQIISSLLSLQAVRIQDASAREVFKESQSRVRSMALIHERLYRSGDLAQVDFSEYVRNLTTSIFNIYRSGASHVRYELDVEPLKLDIDIAVPIGLVMNELVTNAMKYAYPNGKGSRLSIIMKKVGEGFEMCVQDDGVGFPEGLRADHATTLGYELIGMLVNQVHGDIQVTSRDGVTVRVSVPLRA